MEVALTQIPKQSDLEEAEINFQKTIDNVSKEKAALENAGLELKNDIISRENQVLELMDKISSYKRNEGLTFSRYENEIEELKKEIDLQRIQNSSINHQFESITDQYEPLKAIHAQVLLVVDELNESLKELNQKYQSLTVANNALEANLNDIKSKLESEISSKLHLQAENQELSVKLGGFERKADDDLKVVNMLKQQVCNHETVIRTLENQIIDYKSAERNHQAALSSLQQSLIEKDQDIQKFQFDFESQSKFLADQNERIGEFEKTVSQNEMSLSQLAEFWKNQMSSLQKDHIEEINQLMSQLQDIENKFSAVLSDKEALSAQIEQLKHTIHEQNGEKSRISQMLARSNDQRAEFLAKVAELEQVFRMF